MAMEGSGVPTQIVGWILIATINIGLYGVAGLCIGAAIDWIDSCSRVQGDQLETAYDFMHDLAERLANRVQLTTDGHRVYLEAVASTFNEDIDYSMLIKIYKSGADGESRYSPANASAARLRVISGEPDPKHVSTSYVERANLTMRMSMRRFTRLANAFSKKWENHAAMVALYFMYYNFGRVHQTLRVTPAMEAGIADHVWSIKEIVSLLNQQAV